MNRSAIDKAFIDKAFHADNDDKTAATVFTALIVLSGALTAALLSTALMTFAAALARSIT
jgi:hypothetical protein